MRKISKTRSPAERDDATDNHPVYALKAIIQYLVNTRTLDIRDIFRAHPRALEKGFDVQDAGRQFLRLNAAFSVYRREYSGFLTAIQRVLDSEKIVLPPYLYEAAKHSGLFLRTDERSNGAPRFVNFDEIPRLTGDLPEIEPIIQKYAGCWRIYRPSTLSTGEDVFINVSFLNIKPFKLLVAEKLNVPQFSFYHREKEQNTGIRGPSISKIHGLMALTSEHVTLLGERVMRGARSMPFPVQLTWRHIYFDNKHEKIILGLACVPNTEGSRIVGSYFCGVFIEGSNLLNSAEYYGLKTSELQGDSCGTVRLGDLKKQIEDKEALHGLLSMIEHSNRDCVLRI